MAEIKTATNKTERVQRGARLYEEAFRDDPVIRYMLGLPEKSKDDYLCRYFRCLLTAASLNGATFTEMDDWSSCCVTMSPGQRIDNFWTLLPAGMLGIVWHLGLGGLRRIMMEYGPLTDAAKAKGLAGEKRYYYIFFLGTANKARGRGYGYSFEKVVVLDPGNTNAWMTELTLLALDSVQKVLRCQIHLQRTDIHICGKRRLWKSRC